MIALVLFLRMAALAAPTPPVAPLASAAVTYMDLSGPAEPESDFPTISRKGSL